MRKRSLLQLLLIILFIATNLGFGFLGDLFLLSNSSKTEHFLEREPNLSVPFNLEEFKSLNVDSSLEETTTTQNNNLTFFDINGSANDVCIADGLAYIADSSKGIIVVDVTQPKVPTYLSTIPTNRGSVDKIVVIDGYAYVLEYSSQIFSIYDVQDIYNGSKLYESVHIEVFHLVVENGYAYVTCDDLSLAIYNVSDPLDPYTLTTLDMNHSVEGLFKHHEWLYVALKEDGMALIDVSDPANPITPIYYPSVGTVNRIFVNDYGTYLSNDGGCFLSIYDTNKSNFQLLTQFGSAHEFSVWASRDYAFILEVGFQFSIYDVQNITSPRLITFYDSIQSPSRHVVYSNGFIFIAHDISGLAIFDVRGYEFLSPHAPINITREADFGPTGYNFTGSGVENDPYLISGLNISHDFGNLITIRNTRVHFIIQHNLLNGVHTITSNDGILLDNVTNGRIEANELTNSARGIRIANSSNITLKYNFAHIHEIALSLSSTNRTTIQDNSFNNTFQVGMSCYYVQTLTISHNRFQNNLHAIWMDHGTENNLSDNIVSNIQAQAFIITEDSLHNQIRGNWISDSGGGIDITYGSHDNILLNNTIEQTDNVGIYLDQVNNTLISNNSFLYNFKWGIQIQNASDNDVLFNHFIQNNPMAGTGEWQAYDMGTLNTFEYNYWSDWTVPDNNSDGIIDLPYTIEGPSLNTDPFPLAFLPGLTHNLFGLRVLFPNGGEILNGTITILWDLPVDTLGHVIEYAISYSRDYGANWTVIVAWVVWDSLVWETTLLPQTTEPYLIKVEARCSSGLVISDISDGLFYIDNTPPETTIPPTTITTTTTTIPFTTQTTTTHIPPTKISPPNYGEDVVITFYKGSIFLDGIPIPLVFEVRDTNHSQMIGDTACNYGETYLSFEKGGITLDLGGESLTSTKIVGSTESQSWVSIIENELKKSQSLSLMTISGKYDSDTIEMTTRIQTITDYIDITLLDDHIIYTFNINVYMILEYSINGEGQGLIEEDVFYGVSSTKRVEFLQLETIVCADKNEYNTEKVEIVNEGWDWDYDFDGANRLEIYPAYSFMKNYVWFNAQDFQMVKTEEYGPSNNLYATYSIYIPRSVQGLPEFVLPLSIALVLVGGGGALIVLRKRFQSSSTSPVKVMGRSVNLPNVCKCSRCGNLNLGSYTFCIHCGNQL